MSKELYALCNYCTKFNKCKDRVYIYPKLFKMRCSKFEQKCCENCGNGYKPTAGNGYYCEIRRKKVRDIIKCCMGEPKEQKGK